MIKRKNLYLITAILATFVFIGFLSEPGPYDLLGYAINIWIIRLAWLFIAVLYFTRYWKLRTSGDQAK